MCIGQDEHSHKEVGIKVILNPEAAEPPTPTTRAGKET